MQDDIEVRLREYNQLIGAKLRYFRVLGGFTQEKLGFAIGVTFQQIQKNERGINGLSAARLQLAAEALNIPVESLYGQTGTSEAADIMTNEAAKVLHLFHALPDMKQRAILHLLREFADNEREPS